MDLIVFVPMATDYNILYGRKDKASKTYSVLYTPFLLLENED